MVQGALSSLEPKLIIGVKSCSPPAVLDHHMAALGAGACHTAEMSESTGAVLACVNFIDSYKPANDVCVSPWKND